MNTDNIHGICKRCGQEFEYPFNDRLTNVCGSCADDLRQESDADYQQYMDRLRAEED